MEISEEVVVAHHVAVHEMAAEGPVVVLVAHQAGMEDLVVKAIGGNSFLC